MCPNSSYKDVVLIQSLRKISRSQYQNLDQDQDENQDQELDEDQDKDQDEDQEIKIKICKYLSEVNFKFGSLVQTEMTKQLL